MKARRSFILHFDSLEILDELTDEQAGQLFKAIKSNRSGEDLEVSQLVKIALSPFKSQFLRDDEKYSNVVKRNGINGSRGGRPKNPKEPSGLIDNPEKPRKAVSVSVSGSDSVSVSKSDSEVQEIEAVPAKRKPTKQLVKPDYMEVYEYIFSRGIDQATARIESEKFVDHFTSNGWRVGGKTPMRCWKASVRNWTKNITKAAGVTHGQSAGHQQPKPSLVDRVKQQAEQRLRSQEASAGSNREFSLDAMAQTDRNVRVQVCEPVRGDTRGDLGDVLNGDYWPTNG